MSALLYAQASSAATPRSQALRAFHSRSYTGQSVWPVTTDHAEPTRVIPAITASRQPMGWATKLSTRRPFAASAKAVVIPQDGHGTPKRAGHEHAGRPSAWCVPKPCFAGASDQATPSSAAVARNTKNPVMRRRRTSSAATGTATARGGETGSEADFAARGSVGNSVTGGERSRTGARWRTFRPMHAGGSNTFWADAHLDLAYLAVNGRDMTRTVHDDEPHACTLRSLADGGVRVAFGTIFTELGGDPAKDRAAYRDSDDIDGAHRAGILQLEWYEAMERAGEIDIIRTQADFDEALAGLRGRLGVVILMECADPIRSPDEVAWWHARGLRVVGMSWGHGSRYAGGNARAGGITGIGRRLVEALDGHGILHDASHLSRAAFDDLLALSPRTVIASHSNAQALLPESERHLTDGQIGAIRDRRGWVGLNLYGRFLAHGRRATIDDCVRHTMHVAEIAGFDRVGLGSDLDGGFGRESLPLEVQSPAEYGKLLDALDAAGFGARGGSRGGFAHANLARVITESGCLQHHGG
jgi:membrane dipeptidase